MYQQSEPLTRAPFLRERGAQRRHSLAYPVNAGNAAHATHAALYRTAPIPGPSAGRGLRRLLSHTTNHAINNHKTIPM
jgi:hypothetical protein